jgi:hypothetical protein
MSLEPVKGQIEAARVTVEVKIERVRVCRSREEQYGTREESLKRP